MVRSPSLSKDPTRYTHSGIMPKAAVVLMAVMAMERLMSPPYRRHQKLDAVPPVHWSIH